MQQNNNLLTWMCWYCDKITTSEMKRKNSLKSWEKIWDAPHSLMQCELQRRLTNVAGKCWTVELDMQGGRFLLSTLQVSVAGFVLHRIRLIMNNGFLYNNKV